jgi:hypothetical protein
MPFGTGDKQCCKGNASVEKVLDAVHGIARVIVEIEQRLSLLKIPSEAEAAARN